MSRTQFWLTVATSLAFAVATGCGKTQIREEGAGVSPSAGLSDPTPAAPSTLPAAAALAPADRPPAGTGAVVPAPSKTEAPATWDAAADPGLRRIHFDYDEALLRPEAREILTGNAKHLSLDTSNRVRVEGHCDERGTGEYNLALGERRAKNAVQYLVDLGVDPARLDVVTYGEEAPLVPGHQEVAWAQNRRVEFVTLEH